MDVSHIHPALLVWSFLAVPLSGISYLIMRDSAMSHFYLFLMIMNLSGSVVLWTGLFHSHAEESSDWEENQEAEQIGTWALIGLVVLFVGSLILSLWFNSFAKGEIYPIIDVPFDLFSLSATPMLFFAFVTDLFGTWFAVVPGEENMKNSFMVFRKVYEDSAIADAPYCVQPARIFANSFWAVEHIIIGQHPWFFFFSVLTAGICLDVVTARTGTPLISWLVHASFNTILLTVSFLGGGFFKIVPS